MVLFTDRNREPEKESFLASLALAPVRGVAGAAAGVANLFGADVQNNFGLGHSDNMIAGFLESTTQFLTGFIPAAGIVSKLGTVGKGLTVGKAALAGAITDATVFDGDDERLSNLIQSVPALQNPITEFLQSSPDDSEIAGRLKNAIEGLGLGMIADGVVSIFGKLRKRNAHVAAGEMDKAAKLDEQIGDEAADLTMDREADEILDELADPTQDPQDPQGASAPTPPPAGAAGTPPPAGAAGTPPPAAAAATPPPPTNPPISLQSLTAGISTPGGSGGSKTTGTVILVNVNDTGAVMRGFSEWDAFVQEPDAKLALVELDENAKIVNSHDPKLRKVVGRRKAGQTPEAYKLSLAQTAAAQGYDAINYRTDPTNVETVILNRQAVKRNIVIKEGRPVMELEARAQLVGRNMDIVNTSKLEAALVKVGASPEQRAATLEGVDAMVREFRDAGLDANGKPNIDYGKLPGVINFANLAEGEGRAVAYAMIETLELGSLKDSKVTNAMSTMDAAVQVSKWSDVPADTIAKIVHRDADNVNGARVRLLATDYLLSKYTQQLHGLMTDIVNVARHGGVAKTTTKVGQAMSLEQLVAQYDIATREYTSILSGTMRLRASFGRALQSRNLNVEKMNPTFLKMHVESIGGVEWTVQQAADYLENYKAGGAQMASKMLAKKSWQTKAWAMALDYYFFSLLSSIRTVTTNMTGMLVMPYRLMETMVGAKIAGKMDPSILKGTMRVADSQNRQIRIIASTVINMLTYGKKAGFAESTILENTGAAWKNNSGTLLGNSQNPYKQAMSANEPGFNLETVNAIFGKDIKEDSALGRSISWLAHKVQLPSRLMGAPDEFAKSLSAFSYVRAELEIQALERGLKDEAMEDWVQAQMRDFVKQGELLSEDRLYREAEVNYPREQYADQDVRNKHVQEYVNNGMRDTRTDPTGTMELTGRSVQGRSAIAARAKELALGDTFQTALDPERGFLARTGLALEKLVSQHPSINIFAPFRKTPLNLLAYAVDRMPLPVLNKQFMGFVNFVATRPFGVKLSPARNKFVQAITSGNPQVAAEAWGRATTAVGFTVAGLGLAASGVLTGRGPTDPEHRKALQQAGWQPYSVKVGDAFVSYQRMDPFASLLGLFADVVDIGRYGDEEQGMTDLAMNMTMAVLTNLESKSYLAGLSDAAGLISNPAIFVEKTAQRLAGTLVPNIVATARGFTDPFQTEVNGVLEAVINRIPFLSNKLLSPQRNLLGEPVSKKTFSDGLRIAEGAAGYMLPLAVNVTTSDIVNKELANLAYPFSLPRPTKWGVDLREYKNDKGQTAYDRWMQLTAEVDLGGRKLRPTMERLIRSAAYQKLDSSDLASLDVDSPRVLKINSVVTRFRREAERRMLAEFPDVRDHTRTRRLAREAMLTGADTQTIKSTLFPTER